MDARSADLSGCIIDHAELGGRAAQRNPGEPAHLSCPSLPVNCREIPGQLGACCSGATAYPSAADYGLFYWTAGLGACIWRLYCFSFSGSSLYIHRPLHEWQNRQSHCLSHSYRGSGRGVLPAWLFYSDHVFWSQNRWIYGTAGYRVSF